MTTNTNQLLQLRIRLNDVEPVIWRQVLVPDSLTFAQLSEVILGAMGWEGGHLHEFQVGDCTVGNPEAIEDLGDDWQDEVETRLSDLISGRSKKFKYWYDFGDDWWHDISIEKRLPDDGLGIRVLAGENACPPEDCGGPFGYPELLEALADENHPNHEAMLDWLGGGFDPAKFDLEEARRRVRVNLSLEE